MQKGGRASTILAYLSAAIAIAAAFLIQTNLLSPHSSQDWQFVRSILLTIFSVSIIVAILASIVAIPLIMAAEKKGARQLPLYLMAGMAVSLWVLKSFDFISDFIPAPPAGDEIYNVDNTVFFLGMTKIEFLLLLKTLLSGALGGITYWAIAGRHSGAWKTKP